MTRWWAVGRGETYQRTDDLIVSSPSDGGLEIRRSPWTPLTIHRWKFNARGTGGFLPVLRTRGTTLVESLAPR